MDKFSVPVEVIDNLPVGTRVAISELDKLALYIVKTNPTSFWWAANWETVIKQTKTGWIPDGYSSSVLREGGKYVINPEYTVGRRWLHEELNPINEEDLWE